MNRAGGMWGSRQANVCKRHFRSLSVARTSTMAWEVWIDYSCQRPSAGLDASGACTAARSARVPDGRTSWTERHHY